MANLDAGSVPMLLDRLTKLAPDDLKCQVEGLDRSQADKLILHLIGQACAAGSAPLHPKQPDQTDAPKLEAAAAPSGPPIASAPCISCLVPRGRFDLAVASTGALVGTAASQKFSVSAADILHLLAVPKGDTVQPTTLVVAQLRVPLTVTKTKDGSSKATIPYVVMQVPQKGWDAVRPFIDKLAAQAKLSVSEPCNSVFRTVSAKPNQPICALKVRTHSPARKPSLLALHSFSRAELARAHIP